MVQDSDPAIKELVLDSTAHRVWLGIHEIMLTPREFAVLAYLVRYAGRLVTDTELLSVVWGSDEVIGNAALRSVIKRLRRKLGDDPKSPRYITTVWGHGYRFEKQTR
jgi:two-component system, OmpR family, KDP operon response regulator KdpE